MIELNAFEMPRRELFKLARLELLRNFWGLMGIALILWGLYIICLQWAIAISHWWFLGIFLFVLIVCTILPYFLCWHYFPEKHTHLYQKTTISFDVDKLHILCEDGLESHILWVHIVKADRIGNYYRLYQHDFSYVPVLVSAFHSEEDRMRFETEILGDKLKPFPWKRHVVTLLICTCVLGVLHVLPILLKT
jgi:hypothetical protein